MAPRKSSPASVSDAESDYSTDSDCDYELDEDTKNTLATSGGLTQQCVRDIYRTQRGVCRVTGIPFATVADTIYSPVLSKRRQAVELNEDNAILVIQAVERMRAAMPGESMSWRTFVALVQMIQRDIEI